MIRVPLCILAIVENTVREFKWGNAPPAWFFFFCLLLPILIVVGVIYKKEARTASGTAKFFLALVRIVLLLALLGIFFEPIIEETFSQIKKSNLLVLIDNSLSMNIVDQYRDPKVRARIAQAMGLVTTTTPVSDDVLRQVKRIDIINQILRRSPVLRELGKKAHLKFFTFSNTLTALPALEEVQPRGQHTNIFDHLIESIDHLKGRGICAIVLLSDGQHNYGKHTRDQVIAYAQRRQIPIYTVGIGSPDKRRDIVMTDVQAPDVALVDDRVRFEIEIEHQGYEGEDIPIYLKLHNRVVEEKFVRLGPEGHKQMVSIYYTFHVAGKQKVTITIPGREDEFSKTNNFKEHTIEIIQDELRVLYLDGYPRWEYRYLKNALIRDRTVLANTWLFSADPEFPQEKSKRAPSINGFPSKEELFKYHCVILGDVALQDLTLEQQKLLVTFVEKVGGGLAFISGPRYNPKDYLGSPLEALLPVIISSDEETDFTRQSYPEVSHLKLTAEGKVHPIMRLAAKPNLNQILWENPQRGLPGYFWFFPVTKAKPGATVLARDYLQGNKYGKRIIMATQFYGAGRTFFTALDSSWRWRFLVGDRYFYRFWGQVIRHISIGLLLGAGKRFQIKLDNPEYAVGDIVTITLYAKDINRKPVSVKTWTIYYQTPSGVEKSKVLHVHPERPGSFEGTLIATELGSYELWVKAATKKDQARASFRVIAQTTEAGNPRLNEALLKKIAQETQGEYLRPYQLDHLRAIEPRPERIPSKIIPTSLWDRGWVLAILIALFALEWIGRKLVRLL